MTAPEKNVILEVRALKKRFGGLVASDDIDLTVHECEILGLIGPNGAGKSTLLNMLSGTLKPTEGKMFFKGEDITGMPPHRLSKRGISRVFQGNVLFRNLTAHENVFIAVHGRTGLGFWGSLVGTRYCRRAESAMNKKACEALALVGLSGDAQELALNLPHGKQRLLCLAVALASDPQLLLLDEPVTGMNGREVQDMLALIRMLRGDRGVTCIVVEHNMQAVMSLCDRIAVISYGAKIAEGSPEEISHDPAVIEAYLGVEQDVA